MWASFNSFEIKMTMAQALSASHSGQCDYDVASLVALPSIRSQLNKISNYVLAAELRNYGIWTDVDLSDRGANENRIIWIAAGDIVDGK